MLNVRGEVFKPASGKLPPGLPQLSGPAGTEKEVARQYLDLKPRLEAFGLRIRQIILDERRAWSMTFDGGPIIKLGSKDLDVRLARFLQIYPTLRGDKRRLKEVDLRYTNGFAVRWETVAPIARMFHEFAPIPRRILVSQGNFRRSGGRFRHPAFRDTCTSLCGVSVITADRGNISCGIKRQARSSIICEISGLAGLGLKIMILRGLA